MTKNPTVRSSNGKRIFACFPAAVMVFYINEHQEFLLLTTGDDKWEIVSGAVEENESILDAAIRESLEELGIDIQIAPLGVVHTLSFDYDDAIPNMISVLYVMRFDGGSVVPGDDMSGAEYAWWNIDQIKQNIDKISKPERQLWLFERALELSESYRAECPDLEYAINPDARSSSRVN